VTDTKLDAELVRELAKLLDETGLGEIEYKTETWKIRVARPTQTAQTVIAQAPGSAAAAPAPQVSPIATPTEPAAISPGALTSPMVGTVYTAPDPDSPDFVSVGATVTVGQTVLIVEAMKVMNPITAPKAGTVTQVLVSNAQPVEYGEVLLVIE